LLLPHAGFTYNSAPGKATSLSPFKVVYGIDPISLLDPTPRPLDKKPSVDTASRVEEIQKIHELVRSIIEKTNASYQAQANKHKKKVVLQPGDLVWIHLRNKRFPSKRNNKLMPRADGPFEVLERINDNAYKVDLPGGYGVSATFNVADLSAYQADDYLADLRIKSSQQGEDDGVPTSQDKEEGPTTPTRSYESSKVQTMAHIVEKSQTKVTGLYGQNVPSFVHLIT